MSDEKQLAMREEPSVAMMLAGIVEKGITEANVSAMSQLIALKERMDNKQAERDFSAAFVALQQEMPVIVAQSVIPNRGKYERFEDLMKVVQPLLTKHGFALSFSNDIKEGRVVETCHLMHVGGHSKDTSFAVKVGKADTESQADCKAATTSKRRALLDALNIVVRQDCLIEEGENDAETEGRFISPKDAANLRDRVEACGADKKKFLEYAEAKSFEEIYESRMPSLIATLVRRENSNRE